MDASTHIFDGKTALYTLVSYYNNFTRRSVDRIKYYKSNNEVNCPMYITSMASQSAFISKKTRHGLDQDIILITKNVCAHNIINADFRSRLFTK